MVEVRKVRLGDIAYEHKERIGEEAPDRPVYGVDKSVGLTAEPRYQSSNLSRYKRIEHGMFAYNPMRLNIGSIGFCHDDLAPGIVSPDYVVFGCRENVLVPRFMDYHTRSAPWVDWLSLAGEGSVRERIYFRKLETYELLLPDVSYQATAVEILSALDNKIELNRRMNETLEALAQAIFKDWFVDFGPTRRKQDGATDPVAILGNLIPDPARAQKTAALFPATLGNDGLPEEWTEREIGEQGQASGGSTPSTKEPTFWEPAEHRWATPKDLSSQVDLALFETERRISDAGLARITSGLLPVGTVLLSSRAPIGYLAISQVPVAINQGFIALAPNDIFGTAYLYLWCKANMEQILANANGSTFQEISKKNFRPIKSAVPIDERVMTAFADVVDPLIARIVSAANESRTLAETRDYLLPKLMSGEVRVRDAEKIVEEGIKTDAKQASSTSSVFGVDLFGSPVLSADQETERDAVMVASVVNTFRRGREVVGNVKIQKGTYFIRRRAGLSVSSFEKQAAGPYDANLNYEGGKPEALAKQWIAPSTSAGKAREYDGSAPGAKIKEIAPLVERYALKDAIEWATKHLASKSRDELECLATVDFAMRTLRAQSVNPTLQLVKADIAGDPKWKPKLKKLHFSDDAIRKAISDLDKWFGKQVRV